MKRDVLPLLRLRTLCQGPPAQPPAAKATNLYKYSRGVHACVCTWEEGFGTGEKQIPFIKRKAICTKKDIKCSKIS